MERAQSPEMGRGNYSPRPPSNLFQGPKYSYPFRDGPICHFPMDPPSLPPQSRLSSPCLSSSHRLPRQLPPRPASRSPPKPRPWGGTRAEAGTGLTGRQGSGVQSVRTRPGRGEGAALPRPTGRWDPQSGEPGAARPLPAHSSCGRSCPAGLWGGAGSWALPS